SLFRGTADARKRRPAEADACAEKERAAPTIALAVPPRGLFCSSLRVPQRDCAHVAGKIARGRRSRCGGLDVPVIVPTRLPRPVTSDIQRDPNDGQVISEYQRSGCLSGVQDQCIAVAHRAAVADNDLRPTYRFDSTVTRAIVRSYVRG